MVVSFLFQRIVGFWLLYILSWFWSAARHTSWSLSIVSLQTRSDENTARRCRPICFFVLECCLFSNNRGTCTEGGWMAVLLSGYWNGVSAFCFLSLFAFRSRRFSPIQWHVSVRLYCWLCSYRSAFVGQSNEHRFSWWRTSTVDAYQNIPCFSRSVVIKSNHSSKKTSCSFCTCINTRILVSKVSYQNISLRFYPHVDSACRPSGSLLFGLIKLGKVLMRFIPGTLFITFWVHQQLLSISMEHSLSIASMLHHSQIQCHTK